MRPLIRLEVTFHSGERIWTPLIYGIAWRDYDKDVHIFYPIPFNIIIGWLRRVYFRLMWGLSPGKVERMILGRDSESRFQQEAEDEFELHGNSRSLS